MSSPQRTTNFPARSSATKERLLSPPFSGVSVGLALPARQPADPVLEIVFSHRDDPYFTRAPARYPPPQIRRTRCPTPPLQAPVPNTITGRDAFMRVLKDEGVSKMFGNPGTTELPIMHALSSAPDMGYVLGLQEAVVIAMADGYARASGKLVSCNVHVAPGLGNAIGSIYTSMMSGTPMIVTAGQQEQGHGLTEPLLYAPLVPIATPVVKWATEVNRIEDLPRILRRAAKVATTAPTGPVFISLPGDILNGEAAVDMG